jgi:quercetin dioxygenase-like cupin family protein
MAEREQTRVRERGALPENIYERCLRGRKETAERQRVGPVVIKPSDRQVELSRQGRLLFYLEPLSYKDTPLQNWRVFTHEVRTKSGKHRHQGGLVIYVIEGKGYSIVEGERIDWKKGDLLLLPITIGGVEHQHFNSDDKPSVWMAFINMPIQEHLAHDLDQMEQSPEFKDE